MKIIIMILRHAISIAFAGALLMLPYVLNAETRSPALVSIIMDDLGYKHNQDFRVVKLPAPIICAIMPHAPLSDRLADEAHRKGKEILLHVPMEPERGHHQLGPGGLSLAMTKHEFIKTLRVNLKSMPLAIGMNNHMGSLLTSHSTQMNWLMDELKSQGYAYVDSMTTNRSVANSIARDKNVPHLVRDIFLDHELSQHHIDNQIRKLIEKANERGSAIAIGHPHQMTIDAVEQFIQRAYQHNIKIVSLTDMLRHRKHPLERFHRTVMLEKRSASIN